MSTIPVQNTEPQTVEIDTPKAIVKHFSKALYNISADNMYQLMESLRVYKHTYSAYPFGEYVHYSDNRTDFKPTELNYYLKSIGLKEITIEVTQPTIEDTFMALAK